LYGLSYPGLDSPRSPPRSVPVLCGGAVLSAPQDMVDDALGVHGSPVGDDHVVRPVHVGHAGLLHAAGAGPEQPHGIPLRIATPPIT